MTKKSVKTKKVGKKKSSPIPPGLLVSDRVQLKDVRLIDSHCTQVPDASFGPKTFDINYSTKLEIDKKNSCVIVIVKFDFAAFTENNTQKPAITISASFLLVYEIANFDGLTQEGFKQFADLNGIYNAWPYWREFVQNTIVRMGLPSLSIPVFRIVNTTKKRIVKKKTAKKKGTKT